MAKYILTELIWQNIFCWPIKRAHDKHVVTAAFELKCIAKKIVKSFSVIVQHEDYGDMKDVKH